MTPKPGSTHQEILVLLTQFRKAIQALQTKPSASGVLQLSAEHFACFMFRRVEGREELSEFTAAFIAVFSWALLSVVSRVLMVNLALDPWLFSFVQLMTGGVTLLAIGFRSRKGRSFTRVSTWALGGFRVLSAALYTVVLATISVLEAGTLGAINLPILALMVFVLSRTTPRRLAWIGHAAVLLSVVLMASRLEAEVRWAVLGLLGLNALCLGAMNLIAEHHPENKSATLSERAWFTGVVLTITAAVFLSLRVVQGGEIVTALNWPLMLSSVTVGVMLRAPSMFMTFWAISVAGAQGYTAAIALLPLFGMVLEQAAIAAGLLETSRFQAEFLYLALLALGGTLLVGLSKRR